MRSWEFVIILTTVSLRNMPFVVLYQRIVSIYLVQQIMKPDASVVGPQCSIYKCIGLYFVI